MLAPPFFHNSHARLARKRWGAVGHVALHALHSQGQALRQSARILLIVSCCATRAHVATFLSQVYAIEASPMAKWAEQLCKGNPAAANVVEVVEGKVEVVSIPEKADILISEPMGTLLVNADHACVQFWVVNAPPWQPALLTEHVVRLR